MHFTINDMNFDDKKVLIRLGSDVPVNDNGDILDDSRLLLSLPTIKHIIEKGASKLILICHLGRPTNNEEYLKTNKLAKRLSELLNMDVDKVDNWSASENKIVFLENLRFNPLEKSKNEEERDNFAKELSSQADIFVQDAFSNCHRDHASMTSIPKFIPSCTGIVVEKELRIINHAMNNPKKPFISIIGGLKADKLNAVSKMLEKADNVLIAGALAFTLLKAKGYNMGSSRIDLEGLENLNKLKNDINSNEKIILPEDAIVADNFSNEAESKVVDIDSIPENYLALDIGPISIKKYCDILDQAKTVVWNGPIGVFEFEKFANGTKEIAKKLTEIDADVIVGGGDSAEAIYKLGIEDKITHVSSGGGASLELFEGKKLIAIKSLEENFSKFRN